MGHECVGVIEALGSGADTDMTGRPLAVGDRVYLVPALRCGRCYFCVVTREPVLCTATRAFGFGPLPDKPREVQGGYAQYLYLPPGARHFGCRLCHGLTYLSCQEAHVLERMAERLSRRLGRDITGWTKCAGGG